jgi:hypothetical protein
MRGLKRPVTASATQGNKVIMSVETLTEHRQPEMG